MVYFVMLVEIIPIFHYCLISCFANCSGTLKIDKVIIIGNFQISIFILLFMLFLFFKFLFITYREYFHDLNLLNVLIELNFSY